MSGEGSQGQGSSHGQRGSTNPSAFDWGGMFQMLSSSSPGTQDSSAPVYQPPRPPTKAFYRPSFMGFGSTPGTQGLSQNPEEPGADDEYDANARHPYTAAETGTLFDAWISTSEDPIVGNQQSRKVFWKKVTENYNMAKPKGTPYRNMKMLRFGHCDQSGANAADILRAAMKIFHDDTGRAFKYTDVWEKVRHLDRWAGGIQSSTGSSSKRTKHTAGGQYSSSDPSEGGEQDATSQFVGSQFAGSDAGGSSGGSRRRPIGTKAAKAARARGGRGRGESSQTAPTQGADKTLMSIFFTATMADTSRMTPFQLRSHLEGIEIMRAQMGLPPGLTMPPPPQEGPQSPTE